MNFRENLKSELEYQDIKVKELALKTGINRKTIDNYLTKNSNDPPATNALKIAQALGLSVEYLLTGKNTSCNGQNSIALQAPQFRKLLGILSSLDELDIETLTILAEQLQKRYDRKNS